MQTGAFAPLLPSSRRFYTRDLMPSLEGYPKTACLLPKNIEEKQAA
jgi:hypothetical protein